MEKERQNIQADTAWLGTESFNEWKGMLNFNIHYL